MIRLRLAENKVFQTIVRYITIDVMDSFKSFKISTKMLFHFVTMFVNIATGFLVWIINIRWFNQHITVTGLGFPTLPIRMFISHSSKWLNKLLSFMKSRVFSPSFWRLSPMRFSFSIAAFDTAATTGTTNIANSYRFCRRTAITFAKHIVGITTCVWSAPFDCFDNSQYAKSLFWRKFDSVPVFKFHNPNLLCRDRRIVSYV